MLRRDESMSSLNETSSSPLAKAYQGKRYPGADGARFSTSFIKKAFLGKSLTLRRPLSRRGCTSIGYSALFHKSRCVPKRVPARNHRHDIREPAAPSPAFMPKTHEFMSVSILWRAAQGV
jgi:hypothetical protein